MYKNTAIAMKSIMLRVEAAFHKFDTDGDGFIDWEEFKQVDFIETRKPLKQYSSRLNCWSEIF